MRTASAEQGPWAIAAVGAMPHRVTRQVLATMLVLEILGPWAIAAVGAMPHWVTRSRVTPQWSAPYPVSVIVGIRASIMIAF